MAIFNFKSDYSVQVPPVELPLGVKEVPGLRQSSHVEGGRVDVTGDNFQAFPYHTEEYLMPGFRSLDEAMKLYFSGIRVPTKDSYRFMRVKVAGGDKSLLAWADDLKEGRAKLPVASISRDSHEFLPEKFSPPYAPIGRRFVSSRGDQVAYWYRPVPYLVAYNITIWTERKRDMEYIMYQIMTRFNPMAEFKMTDGKIAGGVQLRFGGVTDASDKEIGYDQYATVRYELTTQAEAWLPLPERIVKTVLGRVSSIKEQVGSILENYVSNL